MNPHLYDSKFITLTKINQETIMRTEQFMQHLGLTELPAELEKLIRFQQEISGFESYSQGFGVLIDDKLGLKSWSENKDFLNRLLPFAQANGSGSFYTFWLDGTDKSLGEMPIVVFGDEGGVHVVAENLRQLLGLLTFDAEIYVDHDSVYFYKDADDYEASEDLPAFLEWLQKDYQISQLNEAETEKVIENAQEKYKSAFDAWFAQYYAA